MAQNRAKCTNCGDIIISKHRYDWVACKCFRDSTECTGIFIDGGNEYWRCGGKLENLLRYNGKTRKWERPVYKHREAPVVLTEVKEVREFNLWTSIRKIFNL